MVFPNNVHKRAANARKLLAQDRNSIIVQLFLIANVICFFVLKFFFNTFLGLGTSWALMAQLVLFLSIGVLIFRVAIFKEDEKLQEYQDRQSDSFARYLQVRKDNIEQAEIQDSLVHVFEYTNGCVTTTIQFKFGSNNDTVANNTKMVLETIYGLICSYNFEFRTDAGPEIFYNSREYKMHLKQINSISNKKLSLHLRRLSKEAADIADKESNTDALYITLKSKLPGEKAQLESLLGHIIRILSENITCFRSVDFLSIDQLIEFYREFYNIAAIDIAMMKAIELSSVITQDYTDLVKLFSLQSNDGKVYRVTNEINDPFRTKERQM